MKNPLLCLGFGSWLALTLSTTAQTYSIDWHTIDGGGGTSTNNGFTVTGTIGQPDAGVKMSGGGFTVDGGFWGMIAAVQTPGAPTLSIRATGTNAVVVSWPSPSTGFVLQQNSDLNTTNWTDSGLSIEDNGGVKSVIISQPAGNLFFRLKSQ